MRPLLLPLPLAQGFGAWNLRGVRFLTGSTLSSWAVACFANPRFAEADLCRLQVGAPGYCRGLLKNATAGIEAACLSLEQAPWPLPGIVITTRRDFECTMWCPAAGAAWPQAERGPSFIKEFIEMVSWLACLHSGDGQRNGGSMRQHGQVYKESASDTLCAL